MEPWGNQTWLESPRSQWRLSSLGKSSNQVEVDFAVTMELMTRGQL